MIRSRAQELFERGRAAWPTLSVDADAFERHLAAADCDGGPNAQLHAEDLYLACACAAGEKAALAAFDECHLAMVGKFIARIPGAASMVEDVQQMLREKLLVGARPKIGEYSGRGPLGGWVRIAAVRLAIDLARKWHEAPRPQEDVAQVVVAGANPELALDKARSRVDYDAALRAALDGLDARDKGLLRMHYLDGLSIDRIAIAYRVHRSTAARWLAAARQELIDKVYRTLDARMCLSPAELASLTALVQSQLHLSLGALLR